MPNVNVKHEYYNELLIKGMNPDQFVNRLLDQHFYPWKYMRAEHELVDRQISELKPTDEELEIINKYLSYQILRDFKRRMASRYEHSLPIYSLDYYMKCLSIAIIERGFDQDRIEKFYGPLLDDIKQKDPDFNLRTYIDNMIRLRFLPNRHQRVINKFETLMMSDPVMKGAKQLIKKREERLDKQG